VSSVADFDFVLPEALIAQAPPTQPGASRLLVLDRRSGARTHATVADLPGTLRAGDLLVVNDTRVYPARLLGNRDPSGGAVECLLLGRLGEDTWDALVHPGQKLKPGRRFRCERNGRAVLGEILEMHTFGRRTVRLWTEDGGPFEAAIDVVGHVPLPPYIRRPDAAGDVERYQTVFARVRGSVAAPTAGLHFTAPLLAALEAAGVERVAVTLHVGYGTFKPVRVSEVEAHQVDAEDYEIGEHAAARIAAARAEGRRVVAVGTTTTRALESAALADGVVRPGRGRAGVFIHPGFAFRAIDGLLTNFHLPRSSLLMLVAAFAGREAVLQAYGEAVAAGYRFYSYGDAMLVL
jgi:S-adenosylmethionine:tRNA ribosyltransferase-isomerase